MKINAKISDKDVAEKYSVALFQGVTNFVLHRFTHLSPKEWQMMYDLAKVLS